MKTYIIAEIGQNHQGEMSIAKKMIQDCAKLVKVTDHWNERDYPGLSAVKFTKRNIETDMSPTMFNSKYQAKHSFATTYGEHRKKLEFGFEDYQVFAVEAFKGGLDLVVTICDPASYDLLKDVKIQKYKIASRDFNNVPLRNVLISSGKPLIASTGMVAFHDVSRFVSDYERKCKNSSPDLTIMHCISEYPAEYEHLALKTITFFKKNLPKWVKIGYSDHSIGIMAPVVAVALGAEVIEKHYTFDRSARGSDHRGAIEFDGMWRIVRDIRNLELSMLELTTEQKLEITKTARLKLGRSLCLNVSKNVGDTIEEKDLAMTSPGWGYPWELRARFIGKKIMSDYKAYEIIDESYISKKVREYGDQGQ